MESLKNINLANASQVNNSRVNDSKRINGGNSAAPTDVSVSRDLFGAVAKATATSTLGKSDSIRDLQAMAAGQTGQVQKLTTQEIKSAIANAKNEITAATNPLEITEVISRFTAKF
jgi:hypothetical protein